MAKADVIYTYNPSKQYSTSTEKGHRFIPQIPQDFDCVGHLSTDMVR